MEPHVLLLIFLPIIGFSAAISQEPHMLRKSWGQVGASQKLACVIDGESLMNDGSALVIFLLLQDVVEGNPITVGGPSLESLRDDRLSCYVMLTITCPRYPMRAAAARLDLSGDPTLTTVVTLLSAYASYYCADGLVGASGLLAVVCNGFTMSLIGGRQIAYRAEEAMHAFWGVLEWGANTILFVWMGIVLAIVLPPSHEHTQISSLPIQLEARDAGYVVVLYLWLQVARALLLLICWIPFKFTGYPLTWKSALVMVWGGLRGAVGMVMALFIFLDDKIHDDKFRSYCIFYMGTMAFFTVLINGGTCKWLLEKLGFLSYTPEQLGTLKHVVEDMDDIRTQHLADMRPDEVLGEPEPVVVKVWSELPTDEVIAQAEASTVRPPIDCNTPEAKAAVAAGLDPQILYDYRCRVLNMVKAHYAEVYGQHMLSTMQVRTLQAVTDVALDKAGTGLGDWRLLEPNCRLKGLPELLRNWKLHHLFPTFAQAAVYNQQLDNLQLLAVETHALVSSLDEEHVIEEHPVSKVDHARSHMISAAERADAFAQQKLPSRGGAEAQHVLQESKQEAAAALKMAEALTSSHPSLPAWLRSKQVAGEVLAEQQAFLQDLSGAGLIQPRELLLLEDLMHEQSRNLLRGNTGLSAALHYSRARPPLNVLPLFDSLTDDQVAVLTRPVARTSPRIQPDAHSCSLPALGVRWRVFYPEQLIVSLDTPLTDIIIITKGAVRMRFPVIDGPHGRLEEHTVVASVGDALGVCEVMLGLERMSELTADSLVQALLVPVPAFLKLLAADPSVRMRAWQATGAQLAAQHHHILGVHKQLAPLNMFFRACTVEKIEPGEVLEVPRTGLLLVGEVFSLLPLPARCSANYGLSTDNALGSVQHQLESSASSGLLANVSVDGGSPTYSNGTPSMALNGNSPNNSCAALNKGSSGALVGAPSNASSNSSSQNLQGNSYQPPSAAELAACNLVKAGSSLQDNGRVAGTVFAGKQQDRQLLAAPAELPPGEFQCVVEAIVLQVPRGPELPSQLETMSYQAHVLGRGSTSGMGIRALGADVELGMFRSSSDQALGLDAAERQSAQPAADEAFNRNGSAGTLPAVATVSRSSMEQGVVGGSPTASAAGSVDMLRATQPLLLKRGSFSRR
eukprot:gene12274-12411_t